MFNLYKFEKQVKDEDEKAVQRHSEKNMSKSLFKV